MVFSQTSHKTHSILKVVELNHLKPEKVNGETGVMTGGITKRSESPATATSSFSEVFLKPEPLFEDTMFNESECEYFQGLEQWCSDPAKEEPLLTDSLTHKHREDNSLYTDTLHTPFSTTEWEALDASSAQVEHYASTAQYPISPNMDGSTIPDKFLYGSDLQRNKSKSQELIWDIPNLPVLIGHLPPEEIIDLNSCTATNSVDFYGNNVHTHNSQNTEYTSHKTLLMDNEDSLEMKMNPVIPREVESNDVIISEYILSEPSRGVLEETGRVGGLTLNVTTPWIGDSISTPDVLNFVDQLERENITLPNAARTTQQPQLLEAETALESYSNTLAPHVDYHPITPQSDVYQESETEDIKPLNNKRKRRNSEDSDVSYTPNVEYTPRKYRRRKPSVPIKDMILALEESKQQPKRRGRPPKRRESTVSSIGSIDDSTSTTSTHEFKYRELRDKNNEASKRSRMNRKLKELQTEQLAIELEERNKKLKVKADILEDMTKRLKEALMTAILHK